MRVIKSTGEVVGHSDAEVERATMLRQINGVNFKSEKKEAEFINNMLGGNSTPEIKGRCRNIVTSKHDPQWGGGGPTVKRSC